MHAGVFRGQLITLFGLGIFFFPTMDVAQKNVGDGALGIGLENFLSDGSCGGEIVLGDGLFGFTDQHSEVVGFDGKSDLLDDGIDGNGLDDGIVGAHLQKQAHGFPTAFIADTDDGHPIIQNILDLPKIRGVVPAFDTGLDKHDDPVEFLEERPDFLDILFAEKIATHTLLGNVQYLHEPVEDAQEHFVLTDDQEPTTVADKISYNLIERLSFFHRFLPTRPCPGTPFWKAAGLYLPRTDSNRYLLHLIVHLQRTSSHEHCHVPCRRLKHIHVEIRW